MGDELGDRTATADAAVAPSRPQPKLDTAITPVIQAEQVHIPTPAWGALAQQDLARVEAGLAAAARATPEAAPPAKDPSLGWAAIAAGVATAILHGFAVSVAAAHDAQASTVLAWIAIACSPVAVILGIVAVVLGRGRVPGVLGALVGLFANPWILLQTLTLVAP